MSMIEKTMKVSSKNNDIELLIKYQRLLKLNEQQLFEKFKTSRSGIDAKTREKLLDKYGHNIVVKDDKKNAWYFIIQSFKDQFIIVLLILAVINFILGDSLGTFIIIGIACASAFIRFKQDYDTYKFNCKLKSEITPMANIITENKQEEIKTEDIVVGDIVELNAGSIIPADSIILDSKDLFINTSVFTGESVPVEKEAKYNESNDIMETSNLLLMGSSVVSGKATALVINTGFDTYLGRMGKDIDSTQIKTNFDIGIDKVTKLLIRYMLITCPIVFVINGILRGNMMEALLYSLSVAVGITPSMLPMIVNVNLTKGTKELAKRKVLVKQINSIQNLGSIDTLCTDKTGTLTEGSIVLQQYINIEGDIDESILEYAYLNSFYSTGIKNMLDKAVIQYGKDHNIEKSIEMYEKIDEIPFDYSRKKQSVVVKSVKGINYRLITKGALEEVIKGCKKAKLNGKIIPLNDEIVERINERAKELESNGMQIIAISSKRASDTKGDGFKAEDESNMVFIGFVAFLDPIKQDAKETIKKLQSKGIKLKVLTGDNIYTTTNICKGVGIDTTKILRGSEISEMSDEELSRAVEETDVFVRVNPLEKERIINVLRANKHVVGYMGDGVNDAPSLHNADVGISVNTATDIAKETSDIILLEQSLDVIYDGVVQGRIVYDNIIKYMKMALSADFGDVFSILVASIFIPFLPLLPIQMLIQDFLYDFSQIAIPYDNVDPEFLAKPKKWDTKGLSRFMNVMGITSSVIDVMSFLVFWFIFKWNSVDKASYFQTAWFVECLISETTIIYFIRTAKKPFIESHASPYLALMTSITLVGTILTPILLHGIPEFHYEILPPTYYLYLIGLGIAYAILVEFIKKIYIKKYHSWL
jgi:Mg2+-importing ATPase